MNYSCTIFTTCRWLLGSLPQTPIGDPPLDPAGGLLSPGP